MNYDNAELCCNSLSGMKIEYLIGSHYGIQSVDSSNIPLTVKVGESYDIFIWGNDKRLSAHILILPDKEKYTIKLSNVSVTQTRKHC